MPPLCPLGPTHPDTTIVAIYTRPPPPRHDAHPNLCAAAKVKVSSSRAMRRSGGRWEACWESGSLVMYSDPQLVNTRLMLQSQQGGGARRTHDRFRRVSRLKRSEGVRDFSASSHEDCCHCMTDKPALTVRREESAFCSSFFFFFFFSSK